MKEEVANKSSGQKYCPPRRHYADEGITLGLNLMGHDVSYSILNAEGEPILIAEEERYSRRKKGTFVPSPRRVFEILEEAKVSPSEVRHIAIANIPELMEQRPQVTRSSKNLPIRFGQAQCFSSLFRVISERLCDPESVMWLRHHLCHAASSFLPSPFESATIVTVDGMGEDETATIWRGEERRLKKMFSVRYPHSLGYLYQAVAQWAGMNGAEREGKLMGLASLGEPRYLEVFRERFLSWYPKGGFVTAPNLASLPCDNPTWLAYCEQHFGPRRLPDAELARHHMDVASSIQALLEETLLSLLQFAAGLNKSRYCCLAGGVFMNSMANGRLRREGPFEDLWVQPMATDNGLSLGAALWSYAQRNPQRKRWVMNHPFLGSEVTIAEIETLLSQHNVSARRSDCIEKESAKLLAEGKLVGWVQGRSEIGARALGHRSILADPRDPLAKDRLNAKIKLREDWRPFAPMVLEEDAAKFFSDPRSSPFMMFVTPALDCAKIPAAVHVDQTARIQTVSPAFDEQLYQLLLAFRDLTGIGVLLNTSFNVKGEPIVRTAHEAYTDFIESGMDVLVLADFIIEKSSSSPLKMAPQSAPPGRVQIPCDLSDMLRPNDRVAIISLSSREFLGAALKALPGTVEVLEAQSNCRPILREVLTIDSQLIPISALTCYDVMIVLLPTWVEVAAELAPSLVTPFVELARNHRRLRLVFIDEAGGMEAYGEESYALNRLVTDSPASEIEHFWFTRRKKISTG